MRAAFIRALTDVAAADPRVVLLVGDLGYTVVEPFAEAYPKRFFNVGVAEQNMIGIATGLAEGGFIPYAYSIATFAALRPYEFIRNGPITTSCPSASSASAAASNTARRVRRTTRWRTSLSCGPSRAWP